MTVFLRGSVWWYKFTKNGVEVRESARTKNRNLALDREAIRKAAIIDGASMDRAPKPIAFKKASEEFIEEMAVDWSPATTRATRIYVKKHLNPFFEGRSLNSITAGDINRYKVLRTKAGTTDGGASPRTVNLEIGTLRAIMRKHRLWDRIAPDVKLMRVRTDVGRALSNEEVSALLAAAQKSRSRSLYPALLLSLHTGLRSRELRTLRWADIDFAHGTLKVGESKTEGGRGRVIPLSSQSYDALTAWRDSFPEAKPSHYVFPTERYGLDGEDGYLTGRAAASQTDPTKPIGSWKTAWTKVRAEANVQCRWHDARHTFCSRVGETGVSEQTLIALSGWMSRRMLEVYSHPRMEAKRAAIAAFDLGNLLPGNGVGTVLGTGDTFEGEDLP